MTALPAKLHAEQEVVAAGTRDVGAVRADLAGVAVEFDDITMSSSILVAKGSRERLAPALTSNVVGASRPHANS